MKMDFRDGDYQVSCKSVGEFVTGVKSNGVSDGVLMCLDSVKQKKNTGIRGSIKSGSYSCRVACCNRDRLLMVEESASSMGEVIKQISSVLASVEQEIA